MTTDPTAFRQTAQAIRQVANEVEQGNFVIFCYGICEADAPKEYELSAFIDRDAACPESINAMAEAMRSAMFQVYDGRQTWPMISSERVSSFSASV
jgi:hypothetical protein